MIKKEIFFIIYVHYYIDIFSQRKKVLQQK